MTAAYEIRGGRYFFRPDSPMPFAGMGDGSRLSSVPVSLVEEAGGLEEFFSLRERREEERAACIAAEEIEAAKFREAKAAREASEKESFAAEAAERGFSVPEYQEILEAEYREAEASLRAAQRRYPHRW